VGALLVTERPVAHVHCYGDVRQRAAVRDPGIVAGKITNAHRIGMRVA